MGGKSSKETTQRHFPSYSSPSFSHQPYPQSPYPQQNPNHIPLHHHAPAPYEHGGHTHRKNRKIEKKFSIISDDYHTLEQGTEAEKGMVANLVPRNNDAVRSLPIHVEASLCWRFSSIAAFRAYLFMPIER